MKKKKYSLTIYSDSKHVLECVHTSLVEDGGQLLLIPDEETGEKVYYSNIEWNSKNREDLDLIIEKTEHEYVP